MSAAIPIAGAGLSAYGSIQQGQMTSDTLNTQAKNLTAQAAEAESKGQYDAMREQVVSGQKIGSSIAAYGASGVAGNSGSALDVVQASHQNAELDRQNILHGADIRAINYQNQASMDKYGGQSALLGSYWSALGAMSMGLVKGGVGQTAAAPTAPNYDGGEPNAGAGNEIAGASETSAAGGLAGSDLAAEAAELA
jgi:hypothetical protein